MPIPQLCGHRPAAPAAASAPCAPHATRVDSSQVGSVGRLRSVVLCHGPCRTLTARQTNRLSVMKLQADVVGTPATVSVTADSHGYRTFQLA